MAAQASPQRGNRGEVSRAGALTFGLVTLISSTEFLLWWLLGRFNEWGPIAGATFLLAVAGAILAGLVARWVARPVAVALATAIPLAPFARHFLVGIGIGDPWASRAGVVAAAIGALVIAFVLRGRRLAWVLVIAGLLAYVGGWGVSLVSRPPRREAVSAALPNLVLLVLDTTRPDHLSLHGYDKTTTPRLDAFAREAEVYDNAWSVSPWTPPSHASFFTGLLPAEHGVDGRALPSFPRDLVTIQEVLAESGYRTAGFPANPNLLAPGWRRGFDVYLPSWFVGNHSYMVFLNRWVRGSTLGWEIDRSTVHVLDRARDWWETNDDGTRYLFVNVIDPHHPYRPPARYFEKYLPDVSPEEAYAVEQEPLEYHGNPGIEPRDAAILRGLYDGEIESMDHEVGDFLEWLDARGDLDDTIVAITSDHGERLGEHGVIGHDLFMDPFLLRVPLIVHYPAAVKPARVSRPVQLDGLPGYLLHLAAVEAPEVMAERALHQRQLEFVTAQFQYPGHFVDRLLRHFPDFDPMPYMGNRVFVADPFYGLTWRDDDAEDVDALSDWRADPELSVDLSADHPETVERLRAVAESMPRFTAVEQDEIDPRMLERLRTLGYVD
jgi:arylsulfatase A-like enzyme